MWKWVRREWVAYQADPTQVISWTMRRNNRQGLEIRLVGCWGIELKIWVLGAWRYRAYDSWLAKWLWQHLEGRHQQAEHEEECRENSDSDGWDVRAAERKAGWDHSA